MFKKVASCDQEFIEIELEDKRIRLFLEFLRPFLIRSVEYISPEAKGSY
ncbi:MAG: hypothetical protein QRY71_00235 [Candidatus Rhabdochlamydia sp.]